MNKQYGIVLGFYGPIWTKDILQDYAYFCRDYGFGYFIYAPKIDDRLRKEWAKPFTDKDIQSLKEIRDLFETLGVRFGIGLSPYGCNTLSEKSEKDLKAKIEQINMISPTILGVFFDDIDPKSIGDDLANGQVKVAEYAAEHSTASSFITVPSYYSYDHILQRVLGPMPQRYLEDFGQISQKFNIFWTGQHIISLGYTEHELRAISDKVKRPISIWDNYPVNDPGYLKDFLRIFGVTGRPQNLKDYTSTIAFNPMLQAYASMIPLATGRALYKSETEYSPRQAYLDALHGLCGEELAKTIDNNLNYFSLSGIGHASDYSKKRLISEFSGFQSGMDKSIAADFISLINDNAE